MAMENGARKGHRRVLWCIFVVFSLSLAPDVRCHSPAHSVETDSRGHLTEDTTDSASSNIPQTVDVQCQKPHVEDEGQHTRALHTKGHHRQDHDEHSDHSHHNHDDGNHGHLSEQGTQYDHGNEDATEQSNQHNRHVQHGGSLQDGDDDDDDDVHNCQDHKKHEHEHEHEHQHQHHGENEHHHHHHHGHGHELDDQPVHQHEHTHDHGHSDHVHAHTHHGKRHGQQHHGHGNEPPTDSSSSSSSSRDDEEQQEEGDDDEFTTFERKVYMAFAGTLAITVGGNLVILLFLNMDVVDSTLNILTSFAMGGLLGDVFLHLLPHAMGSSHGDGHSHGHEHDNTHHHHHHHGDDHLTHSHSHDPATEDDYAQRLLATFLSPHMWDELQNGLLVLLGIIIFFVIEKILGYCSGNTGGEDVQRLHGHSHGHQTHKAGGQDTSTSPKSSAAGNSSNKEETADGKQKKKRKCWLTDMQPGAILSLMADAAHNFTDGLAIAASFMGSESLGATTTLAVLVHEVPHELGDFAILIQQGLSPWDAFCAQFVSAFGAMLGCAVGVMLAADGPAWTLCVTAGGFIYIALVKVTPQLLENCDPVQTLKEVGAMCVGIAFMIVIAVIEHTE